MRIKTCAVVLALLVTFIGISAFAQSSLKIAVVDTDKAFKESIMGKKAMEQLEKDLAEWQRKGEQLDKEIIALEEQLATQRDFLDNAEKEQELKDQIDNKKRQGQILVEQGNADLADKRGKLLDPISEEIRNIIKKLAMNENYDLILEKQLIVLYLNPELDITSRIVVMLDQSYKESAAKSTKAPETPTPEQTQGANTK